MTLRSWKALVTQAKRLSNDTGESVRKCVFWLLAERKNK